MQLRDDLQIVDQRPQFGGRAQLQPGVLIDVERLIQIVGLDAQKIDARLPLIQGEAVNHLRWIALFQQLILSEIGCGGLLGIGDLLEKLRDPLLRGLIHGGLNRQIQAVQIVRVVQAQQRKQRHPDGIRRLVLNVVHGRLRRGSS